MIKLLRRYWIFLVILLVGLFLRTYEPLELFMYSHDQDLQGWIIKDILVNKHIRLIGQETTARGVFIGPLFYYLLIPFYLFSKMDPFGTLLLPIILSGFTIFSIYFVFGRVFNEKVGLVASLIYALSVVIIFTDREVAPTMPAVLWTVWFLYSLFLVFKGNKWAHPLIGFLGGIAWNINLALVILLPLGLVTNFLFKQKISFKYLFLGTIIFLMILSPYLGFEIRHNFQQTSAIISSVTTSKDYISGTSRGIAKLDRIFQLVHRNTTSLFLDSVINIPLSITLYSLILIFVFLVFKKSISKKWALIFFLWQSLYLIFFTMNSINPSEYYLNGMNIIWIGIAAIFINHLLVSKSLKKIGVLLLMIFISINLYSFFVRPINKSGYLERKELIDFIANDAKEHNYTCLSISYITSPGNDLGYRYLFWLKNLRVEQPKSGAPPYTIVYPHSKVDRLDKTFGALGLILPDYDRYTKDGVKESCSGGNSNLTDPMFGYTQ